MLSASKSIGLRAALVGAEEIGLVVVDRIDALGRDELVDLDRLRALLLHLLQLFRREGHVLVLRELVTLDHVRALDHDAFARAKVLLLEPRAAALVQQVERDAGLRLRRRKQLDRDRDHAERDGDRSQCTCRHAEPRVREARTGAPKPCIVPKCRWRFNCRLPSQHPEDMDYFAVPLARDRNC
jgi:hypothetical protein